eukprot:996113_1
MANLVDAKSENEDEKADKKSTGRYIELALQNVPVIGHAMGIGYLLKGDKKEAETSACRATFGLIGCLFEGVNEMGRKKSHKLPSIHTMKDMPLMGNQLCNWMSQFPDQKLNQLSIPGSHESGTYSIPDSIVNAWSRCQTLTVYEQLMLGIRYLDFRVITVENEVYIAHRFKGCKFDQCLADIKQFLCLYPTEVILVRLDHNTTGGHCDNAVLNALLKKHMDEFIVKGKEFANIPTISELTDKGTKGRILLLSPFTSIDFKAVNAAHFSYTSSWDNYHCQYPLEWYENYKDFLANYQQNMDVDFILMACELTPEKDVAIQAVAGQIFRGIGKSIGSLFVKEQFTDLEDMCAACNYQVKEFLIKEKFPKRTFIISHDYIHPDIIELILSKNT